MMYVGIDNGLDGAIVALNEQGEVVSASKMPVFKGKRREYDVRGMARLMASLKAEFGELSVVLEKALIVPISGRIAVFSTGMCYGVWQGILESLEISYEVASPKDWQKSVLAGVPQGNTKFRAKIWCQRKFPSREWEHSGIVDACCLAWYGLSAQSRRVK